VGGLDGLGTSLGGLRPLLWPILAVFGRARAPAGGPVPFFGRILAFLGRAGLVAHVSRLALLLGLCGRSYVALGAYVGGWRSWALMLAGLRRSWGLCDRKKNRSALLI